jgi:hypothetical protein
MVRANRIRGKHSYINFLRSILTFTLNTICLGVCRINRTFAYCRKKYKTTADRSILGKTHVK